MSTSLLQSDTNYVTSRALYGSYIHSLEDVHLGTPCCPTTEGFVGHTLQDTLLQDVRVLWGWVVPGDQAWYSDKFRSKVKLGKKTHRSGSSALRALVDDSNRKYSSHVLHLFTSEVNLLLGIPIMKVFCSVDVCARLSLITKTWRHQAEASALIQHFPRAVDSKAKQALMQFQHCFAHRKKYPQTLIQKSWTGGFFN